MSENIINDGHARKDKPPEKQEVVAIFLKGSEDLGLSGIAHFEGFYFNDSNARAKTTRYIGKVSFNEKHLHVASEEKERIIYHELQHVQTTSVLEKGDRHNDAWLFVFHPLFADLHARMKSHYQKHKEQSYPFTRVVGEIPRDYEGLIMKTGANYDHYDEVLALLRSYERYLEQQELDSSVQSEPYEFIEAFEPGDLKLLDPEYRASLADEVSKTNQELVPERMR